MAANTSAAEWVTVHDTRLEMAERGQGRPLLWLHGEEGLDPRAAFLDGLASQGRVLAPSHPGFGHSPEADDVDTVDDLSYLYLDLLAARDLRGVVVIGASLGGWIAAEMAVKCGERLAGLVLVAPLGIKVGDRETRDIPDIFALHPDEVARLQYRDPARAAVDHAILSDDALTVIARNREATAQYVWEPYFHNPKLRRRLRRITVPTLLLWGADDQFVTADYYGAAYRAAIPGARLATIERCGHFPHVEQPAAMVERIGRFLAEGEGVAMRAWFFSENAYHLLPEASEYDSIRVQLPNRYYDPKLGADLYHRFIDEWVIAEDLGLEIMVNEHHQTATNLNPSAAVVMGTLGRVTRKARLLILGNPIANRKEPVRVAEEMAMVDVYSRGRLECGFVRGVPYELSAGNHRPTRMMERFWEAHDLIVKAWTSHDGPFNWEGKHFHHRQVNIWPRPYQDPHPPIWITALSPASAGAVGERGYVVACFLTGWDGTRAVFGAYRDRRAELGLGAPALDRFAYAALVYTGETDAEGQAGARKLLWYIESNKVPPQYTSPPGYHPVASAVQAMKGSASAGIFRLFKNPAPLDEYMERGLVFAGNPDSVYRQIKKMHDHVGGFGHLLIMGQAGFLDHDETVKGMQMFSREVYPRLKELPGAA